MSKNIKFYPTKKKNYDGGKASNKFLMDEIGHWNPKLNGKFVWKNGKPDTEVEFRENE